MTQEHRTPIFSAFDVPTTEAWLAMVRAEMESDDPLATLAWMTPEGITVKPLYTVEDSTGRPYLSANPGEAPYARGTTALGYAASPWRIRQRVPCTAGVPETEILLAEETGRGELEILIGASGDSTPSLRAILDRMHGDGVPILLNAGAATPVFFSAAIAHAKRRGRVFEGNAAYDPLTTILERGCIPGGIRDALRVAADCVQYSREEAPGARTLTTGGHVYHNAGATITQELAYTLAAGIEYLRSLVSHGLTVDEACASMEFSFSIGTNFAFEVAKLRAARMLWAKIVHHFSPADAGSKKMRVHAQTSLWTQTTFDPHVNILRATIETMAAAIGGADSITTLPFDAALDESSESSRRLARNTSVILSEESGFSRIVDPSGGSMYFDALTDEVAGNAWSLLQGVEAEGGILRALEIGSLQGAIRSAAADRGQHIARRKEVFVGTNKYPNLGEVSRKPAGGAIAPERSDIAKTVPLPPEGINTLRVMAKAFEEGAVVDDILVPAPETGPQVDTLRAYRGAEAFERLRAAVERQRRRPKVLLVPIGPTAWRRARATFAAGFLGVAGFDIVDHTGYNNVEDAVAAALQEEADIVVACSNDASYPVVAAELASKLKAKKQDVLVLVAGYPRDTIDALTAAGVDDFIHLGSDALAVLASILARLGIETPEGSR